MHIDDFSIMFFVKFIKPEHQEQFLDGELVIRDLNYYIGSEEDQEKGMADKNEGSFILNRAVLQIGEEIIPEEDHGQVKISSHYINEMPVLCLFAIKRSMFKEKEVNEKEVKYQLQFENGVLEHMKEHFGEDVLLIGAAPFIERVKNVCTERKVQVIDKFVKYFDFSIDEEERIRLVKDIYNPEIAFVKDEFFESQNEYRFAFPSEKIDENREPKSFLLEIGDIREITKCFKADDLLNLELIFKI